MIEGMAWVTRQGLNHVDGGQITNVYNLVFNRMTMETILIAPQLSPPPTHTQGPGQGCDIGLGNSFCQEITKGMEPTTFLLCQDDQLHIVLLSCRPGRTRNTFTHQILLRAPRRGGTSRCCHAEGPFLTVCECECVSVR